MTTAVPNNPITDAPILEEYWTTRDGRKIAVGDMEVDHLRNTLRMILRKRRKAALILAQLNDISSSDGVYYGSPSLQRKYGGS